MGNDVALRSSSPTRSSICGVMCESGMVRGAYGYCPGHEQADGETTRQAPTEGLRSSGEGPYRGGSQGDRQLPDPRPGSRDQRHPPSGAASTKRGNLTKKEHDRIQRKAEKMLKKTSKKNKKK